jgi:hypothetical protein
MWQHQTMDNRGYEMPTNVFEQRIADLKNKANTLFGMPVVTPFSKVQPSTGKLPTSTPVSGFPGIQQNWNPQTSGGFGQSLSAPPTNMTTPPDTTGQSLSSSGSQTQDQTTTGASNTGTGGAGTPNYSLFDYSNYNTPTGPITTDELKNWTGDLRTQYDTIQNTIKQNQGYLDQLLQWQKEGKDANGQPMSSHTGQDWANAQSDLTQKINLAKNGIATSQTEAQKLVDDWRSESAVTNGTGTYTDTIDWLVKNFQTGWDKQSTVKPFESEWTSIFGDAFKNLAGSSNSTDFLQQFLKGFGIDKIATGQVNWGDYGFKDYSPDALLKFLEDGSNIPGWDSKTVEGADVKDEQSFIKFIMDAAKTMLPKLDSDVNLMSDILGGARSEQLKAALQLINQPGMTKEEYTAQVNGIMEPIRQAADSQKRQAEAQAGMVLAGDSTKSMYAKRQIDNNTSVQEASVRGNLTAVDIKMRQENMQYAIATMGSITQSEVDRLKEAANIQGTKNGQVLDFLAKVGGLAVGSKQTEYTAYTDRLNAAQQLYLANADRTLKEKLGIAGISLDLYKTETGLDYDKVSLAYEVALKNRGMNSDEAKAQAASMIEQYKTAAMFAQMDQDKLTKLAQLAAQGQAGDREAWGAYQSMVLEENLKNRGMDITQAQSLAELTFGMWKTDKETALQMWATKYNAQLQKELKQMEIDSQPSPWLSAVSSLFGGIGAILPFLKGTPKPPATNV